MNNNNIKNFLSNSEDPEEIFQILELVGQGTYGVVYKALNKQSGQIVAAKLIDMADKSQIDSFIKEIKILRECKSQYIVQYYGSYYKSFKMWIIMEYCDVGAIYDLISMSKMCLNENQIASLLYMVLKGLEFLHGKRMIHRDIKAANILLNNEGFAKLADFGVSDQLSNSMSKRFSKIGSPYWMSPEVLKGSEYHFPTDVWSLGITAIEIAEGAPPLSNFKINKAMEMISKNPPKGMTKPNLWSNEFNNFVESCLKVDPNKRSTVKQLLKHPFIIKKNKGSVLISEYITKALKIAEEVRNTEQSQEEMDSIKSRQTLIEMGSIRGGTMISKNNSFDAGTIRVSKSIKDEDKQLSNFESNRKQKKESQPEFMRMMDKIKMFDNDFVDGEDEVANEKENKVYQNIEIISDPAFQPETKKIVITYPSESLCSIDKLPIGDESTNTLKNCDPEDKNQENIQDDNLDSISKTSGSIFDIKNLLDKEIDFDLDKLLNDPEVNLKSSNELKFLFEFTSSQMNDELDRLKKKYIPKLSKINSAYNFLNKNKHIKNIKEFKDYEIFSKKFISNKFDSNTITTNFGNSIYIMNKVKTSEYKQNNKNIVSKK